MFKINFYSDCIDNIDWVTYFNYEPVCVSKCLMEVSDMVNEKVIGTTG